jgi:hypothetical protein
VCAPACVYRKYKGESAISERHFLFHRFLAELRQPEDFIDCADDDEQPGHIILPGDAWLITDGQRQSFATEVMKPLKDCSQIKNTLHVIYSESTMLDKRVWALVHHDHGWAGKGCTPTVCKRTFLQVTKHLNVSVTICYSGCLGSAAAGRTSKPRPSKRCYDSASVGGFPDHHFCRCFKATTSNLACIQVLFPLAHALLIYLVSYTFVVRKTKFRHSVPGSAGKVTIFTLRARLVGMSWWAFLALTRMRRTCLHLVLLQVSCGNG